MYNKNLKYKWDNRNVLDYAKTPAKTEERREIVREMKKNGVLIEQIAKFTNLSVEKIENL